MKGPTVRVVTLALLGGCGGDITADEYCRAQRQCNIGLDSTCECSFEAFRRYAASRSCGDELDDFATCMADAFDDPLVCRSLSLDLGPEAPCIDEREAMERCTTGGPGYTPDCDGYPDLSTCAACSKPTTMASVALPFENSTGLVASADHPGVLYAVTSGPNPSFLALGPKGEALDSFGVGDATVIDWSDVARGPCAGGTGSCLYFADIGDGAQIRASYVIYRVAEPASVETGASTILDAEKLEFVYPDGSHDAGALLVHPTTGVVTIVAMDLGQDSEGRIYASTSGLESGTVAELVHMGEIAAPFQSACRDGDVDASAQGVLCLTSGQVLVFSLSPEQDVAAALQTTPCDTPGPFALSRVDGVAWRADAAAYLVFGESYDYGPALNATACSP
jgi:hypothetical protein